MHFVTLENDYKLFKLIKSLYRLKQTPKQQYKKFDGIILGNGFILN